MRPRNNLSAILSRLNGSVWYITPEMLDTMMGILDRRIAGERMDGDEIRLLLATKDHDRQHGDGVSMRGIGILPLYGPIFPKANLMTEMSGATSLEEWRNDFRAMMANDYVSTILMDVDSPGGAADMIPETAAEIRAAREEKDIVAVANSSMNSAAYYLASQASKVYATPSGQVGSVGTILIHTDESRKDEMEGVKRTFISAGKYKADLYKPLTEESKGRLQDFVDHHYAMFVNDVAAGRETTVEDVLENFGHGDIMTPDTAMEVGAIDGIASFDQVLGRLIESGGDIRGIESPPVPVSATGRRVLRESYDADKEHSEPGTGQGGEPTPRDPPEKGDKAIEGGWRRDPPPSAYESEESGGIAVNREWLEARATALGIAFSAETSDEDLGQLVEKRVDEIVAPMSQVAADADRKKRWAEEYPEEAARLERLESKDRLVEASSFADKYRQFKDDPKHGFSTLIRESLADAHLKIAERRFTQEDLGSLLDSMTAKVAVVEWGEDGSARDTEKTAGMRAGMSRQEIRKQMGDLVKARMTEDSMSYKDAYAAVAAENPDLAVAYIGS